MGQISAVVCCEHLTQSVLILSLVAWTLFPFWGGANLLVSTFCSVFIQEQQFDLCLTHVSNWTLYPEGTVSWCRRWKICGWYNSAHTSLFDDKRGGGENEYYAGRGHKRAICELKILDVVIGEELLHFAEALVALHCYLSSIMPTPYLSLVIWHFAACWSKEWNAVLKLHFLFIDDLCQHQTQSLCYPCMAPVINELDWPSG